MALLSFTQLAQPGTVFGPDAFATSIGKRFPFGSEGHTVEAVLVAAVVSPDGTSAEITLDVPAGRVSLEGDGS
jgi:hypothetical protein